MAQQPPREAGHAGALTLLLASPQTLSPPLFSPSPPVLHALCTARLLQRRGVALDLIQAQWGTLAAYVNPGMWQVDVTWYLLLLLERMGLVWQLELPPLATVRGIGRGVQGG